MSDSKNPLTPKTPLMSVMTTPSMVRDEKSLKECFPEKKLTTPEKLLRHCTQLNWSCGSYKAISKEFKKAIESDAKYIVKKPTIAYRGDSRPFSEIFDIGFSAYAFYRMLNHPLKLTSCGINYSLTCCCVTCCPCAFFGYLYNSLCTPADCFGQNSIVAPYASNWSALALTTKYSKALSFHGPGRQSEHWKYILYLDDYIDFSLFSDDKIKSGDYKECEEVYNIGEIFPGDIKNQTVAPERIVGATSKIYKYSSETNGGGYFNITSTHTNFQFNKKFLFWNKIAEALQKNKKPISLDEAKIEGCDDAKTEEILTLIKTTLNAS